MSHGKTPGDVGGYPDREVCVIDEYELLQTRVLAPPLSTPRSESSSSLQWTPSPTNEEAIERQRRAIAERFDSPTVQAALQLYVQVRVFASFGLVIDWNGICSGAMVEANG